MTFLDNFNFNIFRSKVANEKKAAKSKKDLESLPTSRQSIPEGDNPFNTLTDFYSFVKPEYDFEVVPLIRKLIRVNPNLSQALWDLVFLGNTGHKVRFDGDVKPEQVDKMRTHLNEVSKTWLDGAAGVDGISARMFAQVIIGGAISNEWVVKNDLSGLDRVAFLKPETIRCKLNNKGRYDFYQQPANSVVKATTELGAVKLNKNTFKYLALYADGETPYGLPPFIAALEPVTTQGILIDNIRKVSRQTSLMGFLKILLAKPRPRDGQNKKAFKAELERNLVLAKERVAGGLTDGIVVGYNEDVEELDFQATTTTNSGIKDIFNLNEQQMFSGLKSDGSLFGRDFGGSETQITVVLTKLISELYNIQNLVKTNWEFAYKLELQLAGFDPKGITVEFNRSTLLDELKLQQGREIKIKNLHKLYYDGIINLDQYADELGYEKADQDEPRHLWEVAAGEAGDAQDAVNKPNDATRKVGDRQKKKTQEKKNN